MAGMHLIDQARTRLEDSLLNLEQLVTSWSDLVPENAPSPAWLFILQQYQAQLASHSAEFIDAVHKHARPVLKDMERFRA